MIYSPQAAQASIILSLSLIVSYFLTGLWIAAKDVSGAWHQFDLRNQGKSDDAVKPPRTWNHYRQHIGSQFRDLFVALPIGLYIACYHNSNVLWGSFKVVDLIWVPFAFSLNQCWLMMVHYVLHTPVLYRNIHKNHHVPIDYVHSLSAWADSLSEYVFMELMALMVMIYAVPINIYWFAAIMAYLGHVSSIEHSGFYVNWYWDGRYHWTHHTKVDCNYAESAILDQIFGTYVEEY